MDYAQFSQRAIALFLAHQRRPYRNLLQQCRLSLKGTELAIESPDPITNRALWLRRAHIVKPASALGLMTIRFRAQPPTERANDSPG